MKNKRSAIVTYTTSFFLLIGLFLISLNCFTHLYCYSIAKKLPLPQEQELLRFKIYGNSFEPEGNTVSGTISLIDTNGNEMATIERSWSGSYLAVEFSKCTFGGISYFFPKRIYGKEKIIENINDRRKGTKLDKYYNENSQCMLLGHGSNYWERHSIYVISRFSNGNIPAISLGKRSRYILDLSPCKIDTYYSIHRDIYGNLIIEEL